MILSSITSRIRTLVHFFAAQGITMAGNLLYGLLCVRLLPSTEYAKFVVVFAVQGTIIALMDVNFTGTLVPLVGERIHDHQLIADYVASSDNSRTGRMPLSVRDSSSYPFLVKNRGWSWQVVAAMVIILLASTWFMRITSAYGAVLILLRGRSDWYKGQMISSLGTLALLVLLWALHRLGPFSAILLNVAGIVLRGHFLSLPCTPASWCPRFGYSRQAKSHCSIGAAQCAASCFLCAPGAARAVSHYLSWPHQGRCQRGRTGQDLANCSPSFCR